MNFDLYKRLQKPIKNLASAMWVKTVLLKAPCKNIHQLINEVYRKLEAPSNIQREHASKFFYDKNNGRYISNLKKVDKIVSLWSETGDVLNHPLWQLLNQNKISPSFIITMARQLPLNIQRELFSESKGSFSIKQNFSTSELDSLEGLVGLLLIHLWQKISNSQAQQDKTDKSIFKLFLRIFTITYQDFHLDFRLFSQLTKYFAPRDIIKRVNCVTWQNFPIFINEVKSRQQLRKCLSIYRSIGEQLVLVDNLNNNTLNKSEQTKHKLQYLALIEHEKLTLLQENLKKSKGICPKEYDSYLGELRIKFHYRASTMLNPPFEKFMPKVKLQKAHSLMLNHHTPNLLSQLKH